MVLFVNVLKDSFGNDIENIRLLDEIMGEINLNYFSDLPRTIVLESK